uniref:Single-pass membrane protein with coiled-coil domains 2 n=1 Tax=Nannospalax galili TaxID=1026970 RepID=A0A8C6QTE3_NANGA
KTSLQKRTVKKEQQLTEKNVFFQKMDTIEGAAKEITKMDHILDRPDDQDNFSENSQTDFLYKVDPKQWDRLEQESEDDQDPDKRNEQELHLVPEGPLVPSPSQFLAKSVPRHESAFFELNQWNAKMYLRMKELGADHVEWMEKISNIIRKINSTENTVKSLLNEVVSLEDQSDDLEDGNQDANIEVKIIEIRKQLKEMSTRLAQVDACNKAHELKEKLVVWIKNFHKEMDLLNAELGAYHTPETETDSYSSEDVDVEETDLLLSEASPPASGANSPSCSVVWKHALKLFIIFYVVIFTGLSCYILFVDASFVFERVLPSVLGRRTMWELREMLAPFLNLEVEDLLPS